jgi:hypothetical protein
MQEAQDSRVSFQANCIPLVGFCPIQLSRRLSLPATPTSHGRILAWSKFISLTIDTHFHENVCDVSP